MVTARGYWLPQVSSRRWGRSCRWRSGEDRLDGQRSGIPFGRLAGCVGGHVDDERDVRAL